MNGLIMPNKYDWLVLREKSGEDLNDHNQEILSGLGKHSGLLGDIFAGAISHFHESGNLND